MKKTPKEISWVARTKRPKNVGFSEHDPDVVSGELVRVTKENYPRLFQANKEIAIFFNVREPAVYVDTINKSLAHAYFDYEAIVVGKDVEQIFNDEELKALFAHETKHFYQRDVKNWKETWENEHDADRAAVAATDMKTVRSYVEKAAEIKLKVKITFKPLKDLILKFHKSFPGILGSVRYK